MRCAPSERGDASQYWLPRQRGPKPVKRQSRRPRGRTTKRDILQPVYGARTPYFQHTVYMKSAYGVVVQKPWSEPLTTHSTAVVRALSSHCDSSSAQNRESKMQTTNQGFWYKGAFYNQKIVGPQGTEYKFNGNAYGAPVTWFESTKYIKRTKELAKLAPHNKSAGGKNGF